MSWKARILGWLRREAARQAWPRVKRAASAAWHAWRAPAEPKEPTP